MKTWRKRAADALFGKLRTVCEVLKSDINRSGQLHVSSSSPLVKLLISCERC